MPLQPKQQPPYYEPGTSNNTSYTVYTALITQAGTDAPSVIVMANTIGNIVWTRTSPGIYKGTLTGRFTEENTWTLIIDNGTTNTANYYIARGSSDDEIQISTTNSGTPEDDWLSLTSIEIRLYNN